MSNNKSLTNIYRSGFEKIFHSNNPTLSYEPVSITYTLECQYTPDFYDAVTGTFYETKGLFDAADRRKIIAVLKQHPKMKLIMVFQNPNLKISKGSKTTYAMWCDKHAIKWIKG